MRILSFDTATETCSVALLYDGQVIERCVEQPQGHGTLLLRMVDEILNEAGIELTDLDALGFGRGPGGFTGVRIAVSAAQAIGFGIGLPLVPVSNLAMLAQGLYRTQGIKYAIPALDARMGEVYIGGYEIIHDLAQPVTEEQVLKPEAVILNIDNSNWYGVGRGWVAHNAALKMRLEPHIVAVVPELLCHAQDLLPLTAAALTSGYTVAPELALPVYLRNQVIQRR